MATQQEPLVDQWYEDEHGNKLLVVAVDEDDETVEIQDFEGEVEEVDLAAWYEKDVEPVAPPEDWTGPFDDLVADDLGDTESPRRPEDWNGPADEMERED